MNVLDLFAGSCSFANEAKARGHQTYTTDYQAFDGIDQVSDIRAFDPARVPFVPDIIWASPPCTGFSVAVIGRNWTNEGGILRPKSDSARLGIALATRALEIIDGFLLINPALVWFIENPRGAMRKMEFMQGLKRHTVSYCQYGDDRMKPTDVWTNGEKWEPRPLCYRGAPCHVAAPRGSRTGTQGLKGAYDRSRVPAELCREIIQAYE